MAKTFISPPKQKITPQNVDEIIAQITGAIHIDIRESGFSMDKNGTQALTKFLAAIPHVEVLKLKIFNYGDHEDAFASFLSSGAKNLMELHVNHCGNTIDLMGHINDVNVPKIKTVYAAGATKDSFLQKFAASHHGFTFADHSPEDLVKIVEQKAADAACAEQWEDEHWPIGASIKASATSLASPDVYGKNTASCYSSIAKILKPLSIDLTPDKITRDGNTLTLKQITDYKTEKEGFWGKCLVTEQMHLSPKLAAEIAQVIKNEEVGVTKLCFINNNMGSVCLRGFLYNLPGGITELCLDGNNFNVGNLTVSELLRFADGSNCKVAAKSAIMSPYHDAEDFVYTPLHWSSEETQSLGEGFSQDC